MKVFETNKIRNVGITAHGGAGKTSLTESLIATCRGTRLGRVDDGTTVTDYLPEEIKRKVTISTAMAPVVWQDYKINLLDTPGYSDFIGDVISTIAAVDSLVMVVCGVSGPEVQTDVVWDYAQEKGMPRMFVVNKLDREHASFEKVWVELQEHYGPEVIQLHIPIGEEENFRGFIDVISHKAYEFDGDKLKEIPVPEDLKILLVEKCSTLIEAVAEVDDYVMEKYLEGEEICEQDIARGFRQGIKLGKIFPVLCASAINNKGAVPILDAIVKYFPEPKVEDGANKAFVFKTVADPFVGKMSFLRILSGKFKSGETLYNVNLGKEEKIGNLLTLSGKTQDTLTEANAGDIVVIAKLQETKTGHTLTTKGSTVEPVSEIAFPVPNLTMAVSPKSRGDEDKMGNALARLLEEDPTLRSGKNNETKEQLLSGIGDMHLDIVAERFKNKFGVDIVLKEPKIPYRETIKKKVEVQGRHKKQSGGAGQFGDVWLRIEPYKDGDFLFGEEVFGGAVPKNYFPAVEKGVVEAMREGILAGYPATNIKVTLYDGSYHPVDSNEMSFKIAGSLAFKKGAEMANPVILEPIMNLTIKIPEQYLGDIMGDINSRRGRIMGMDHEGKMQIIEAQAPMAELVKYAIDLKAMTQGRGSYLSEFDHYEEVPAKIAESIIAAHKNKA